MSCPICGQLNTWFRKNKSAGLFQGKTACFPLWREAEQEADANTLFKRNAALCRLRFTEVANHGARAVIDSELSFYSGQTRFLFAFEPSFAAGERLVLEDVRFADSFSFLVPQKQIGRTLRGKYGFPSVPLVSSFFGSSGTFTPLGKTVRLSRSCFAEVANQRAWSLVHSESTFIIEIT